jgi:hypothetical protein
LINDFTIFINQFAKFINGNFICDNESVPGKIGFAVSID